MCFPRNFYNSCTECLRKSVEPSPVIISVLTDLFYTSSEKKLSYWETLYMPLGGPKPLAISPYLSRLNLIFVVSYFTLFQNSGPFADVCSLFYFFDESTFVYDGKDVNFFFPHFLSLFLRFSGCTLRYLGPSSRYLVSLNKGPEI